MKIFSALLSAVLYLFSAATVGNGAGSNLFRVCYYTRSATPAPNQLNTTLCTHIIAGFSSVKDGLIDVGDEESDSLYREVTALKQTNSQLKVLLTVGGGGKDTGFSVAFNSLPNRTRFITSALTVLSDYDFDGLDIDWEFPVWNDHKPEDKENFVQFLKEFKFETMLNKSMTGKSLLLTVAVAAPKTIIDRSYNVPEMAKYVDFINLMSYDYHDYFWYTPFTAHNSPLFKRSVELGYFATLNTAWSATYWNQLGMPKSKIMVGIPTYAHTYTLLYPDLNGIGAIATDVGMGGGSISFIKVCEFLASGGVRVFDDESRVPYAYMDYDWISYEDKVSMLGKAKWIKANGFGGAMTFNLNSDDYSGVCNSGLFPLHTILYHAFLD